jgi:hypothetical protein
MFSKDLISAIRQVSGEIASDALASYEYAEYECTEAELMAEMTLDASRLESHGFVQEHEELKRLLNEHSWEDVSKEAEKHICY